MTFVPGEKTAEWATLENLIACLREEEYDILYLVCHGKLHAEDGDSWLWLEDDAGNVKRVCGSDLVARLKDLRRLPRLDEGLPDELAQSACQRVALLAPQSDDPYLLSELCSYGAEAGLPDGIVQPACQQAG